MNIVHMSITHFTPLVNCILISESHWEQQPTQALHMVMMITNAAITLSKEKSNLVYVLNW